MMALVQSRQQSSSSQVIEENDGTMHNIRWHTSSIQILHLVLVSVIVIRHRRCHRHHSTILGSQISQRFIKLMNYKHSGKSSNHHRLLLLILLPALLQHIYTTTFTHWHHHGSEKWCHHRRNDSGGGSTTSPELYIRGLIGGEIFFFPFSSLFRKYLLARITKLLVAIDWSTTRT